MQPGEGSREILELLPVPKETPKELEMDCGQGPGMAGRGGMGLS